MKRVGLWMIGIGVFITVGLIPVQPGHPASPPGNLHAQEKDTITCTLETPKGRHLFANSGWLFPPAFGVTEPTPAAAAAGFYIFHGDGTATAIATARINAETVLENAVLASSYTVNADCTGTFTVLNGPSFGMFIAPDGRTIAWIATDPGNQVSYMTQRVAPK